MKRIFKTVEDHLIECTTLEKGCWVHLQSPSKEEIDGLNTRFALDSTYLAAALDEEESARVEHEPDKNQTLIIVDIPFVEAEGAGYVYSTIPLGIILADDIIIGGEIEADLTKTISVADSDITLSVMKA